MTTARSVSKLPALQRNIRPALFQDKYLITRYIHTCLQIDRQAEAGAQRQPRGQGGGGTGEGAGEGAEGRRQGQKQGAGATAEADRAEAEAKATKASLGACAGNCRKEKN